ncbi:MAG: hypothetical protein J6X01_01645 [Bacteroidales bacterium]|nr:hypothetical protein [Bacteroidales bacterium]
MKRIILCLMVFLLVGQCSFAQSRNNTQSSEDKETAKDDNIKDKGFDIIFAGGCYFGSKYNAQYYSGDYANENNLDFLFGNKYRYDEINRMIIDHYPYISDSIHYGGPLGNIKYRVAVMIQLGVRYKFTKNWSVQLVYSFSRLKANGQFRLLYEAVPGNYHTGMLDNQYILGKEDRSLFDLSACYLFSTKSIVKPFIEAGIQFNFVRVKSMEAVFYDANKNKLKSYSFINDLQNYVPGVQSDGRIVKYGGPGFGFSATAGIKIAFNKYVSIDPCFYFNAGKFGLEGYKDFSYNFGVLVRIVMNDSMFSK